MKSAEFLIEFNGTKKIANTNNLLKILENDCSEALSASKHGNKIFKGLRNLNGNFFLADPTKKIRHSRNTNNYYTLLLDNLPSWANYPKRSNSLICTNSKWKADLYGAGYAVIPVNGTEIAVCPADDIWFSFKANNIYSLGSFNKLFNNHQISEKNYVDFLKSCLREKNYLLRDFNSFNFRELAIAFKDAQSISDFENIFNKIFDPTTNGFKKYNLSNMNIGDESREIWTSGKSYLINTESMFYKTNLETYNGDY
jgi:hypothetical protein